MNVTVGRAIFHSVTQRFDSARNRAPKKFKTKNNTIMMNPLTIPFGQLRSCTPSTVVKNPVSGNRPPR